MTAYPQSEYDVNKHSAKKTSFFINLTDKSLTCCFYSPFKLSVHYSPKPSIPLATGGYMMLQNPYSQTYPQQLWKKHILDNLKIPATPLAR